MMPARNIIVNLPGNTIVEDGYVVGKSSIILKFVVTEGELSTEYEDGEISGVESNQVTLSAFNDFTGEQYRIGVLDDDTEDGSIVIQIGSDG